LALGAYRDLVWHNGQTGGSRGFIGLDQERHAVVVLSNSVSFIDDIGVHLLDARVELAAVEEREELTLAPEVLGGYVGVYQLAPTGTVTVTRTERGLVAEATGFGVAPIDAASETEFFGKVINVQLTFQRDATGAVTGLVLRHGGKDIPGTKLKYVAEVSNRTRGGGWIHVLWRTSGLRAKVPGHSASYRASIRRTARGSGGMPACN
jgi:hypothetical protein